MRKEVALSALQIMKNATMLILSFNGYKICMPNIQFYVKSEIKIKINIKYLCFCRRPRNSFTGPLLYYHVTRMCSIRQQFIRAYRLAHAVILTS